MSSSDNSFDPALDHRVLTRRIQTLERRQWMLLTVVALGTAVAGLLGFIQADDQTPGIVRATTFELIDGENRDDTSLRLKDGGPEMAMFDSEGKQRIAVGHNAQASGFFAMDETETIRVGAAQFGHGGGGFALHGTDAKGALVLYLKDEGSLTHYGEDGFVIARWPHRQSEDDR